MHRFNARIEIIGVNPFVQVPARILEVLFAQANKDKGPIPIQGHINGEPYTQTLVKYSGAWRLYINTTMLKNSPNRIGEQITLTVAFDPADRSIPIHPLLVKALEKNKAAKKTFDSLPPSRRQEIIRYIARLKNEATVLKNIEKAISHLQGAGVFAGRKKPK